MTNGSVETGVKYVRNLVCRPVAGVRPDLARIDVPAPTLAAYDPQPDLGRDAVLQVCGCGFLAEAANVVLVGGVGIGKTHLAIALGMACRQHDYRARFVTAAELVTLLVEAQQGWLTRKLVAK